MFDIEIKQYHCDKCHHTAEASKWCDDRENLDGPWCGECGEHVEPVESRPARYVSVAMYYVTHTYGGPEKGGWYYDYGDRCEETVRCFELADLPVAKQYEELLWNRIGKEWGLTVRTFVEQLPDTHFPLQRPYYS